MKKEQLARICHQLNRAYCEAIGDHSQKDWEEADEWQRDSAVKGVEFKLANPNAPESAQHDAWMNDKLSSGWVYGETKDAEKKTHPCIVPYDELPIEQRKKDALFIAVVNTLKDFVSSEETTTNEENDDGGIEVPKKPPPP